MKNKCCQDKEKHNLTWVTFKNGTKHIEARCKCGTFIKYVSHDRVDHSLVKDQKSFAKFRRQIL